MMIIFIIQVHDPVIHLEVDEEQWEITQGSKRQARWVWSPCIVLLYVTKVIGQFSSFTSTSITCRFPS